MKYITRRAMLGKYGFIGRNINYLSHMCDISIADIANDYKTGRSKIMDTFKPKDSTNMSIATQIMELMDADIEGFTHNEKQSIIDDLCIS